MFIFAIISLISLCCLTVESSSCYNTDGKALCDVSKCPGILNCKGNIGRDHCNCCKVCLKQGGEICGGLYDQDGKCEHGMYCIKTPQSSVLRCDTLKHALIYETPKYIIKMKECKKSPGYLKERTHDIISCFLNAVVPTFYCKKILLYRDDDCCMHKDGCHPNKDLYDKIDVNIDTSILTVKSIQRKKSTKSAFSKIKVVH